MIGRQWLPFILVCGLLCVSYTSQAQQITPLHAFFQQNFDSTLIYQRGSNSNNSPNYLILAKYQNRLEFFTYMSPYRDALGHYFPGKLSQKFMKEEQLFRNVLPDTNRYLLPKFIAPAALRSGWQQLYPHQLWAIAGDGEALRSSAKNCVIEDADENTFYLIDKRAIRVANFYAPEFYEHCAGPNRNRQQAIKARNIVLTLLQQGR